MVQFETDKIITLTVVSFVGLLTHLQDTNTHLFLHRSFFRLSTYWFADTERKRVIHNFCRTCLHQNDLKRKQKMSCRFNEPTNILFCQPYEYVVSGLMHEMWLLSYSFWMWLPLILLLFYFVLSMCVLPFARCRIVVVAVCVSMNNFVMYITNVMTWKWLSIDIRI